MKTRHTRTSVVVNKNQLNEINKEVFLFFLFSKYKNERKNKKKIMVIIEKGNVFFFSFFFCFYVNSIVEFCMGKSAQSETTIFSRALSLSPIQFSSLSNPICIHYIFYYIYISQESRIFSEQHSNTQALKT